MKQRAKIYMNGLLTQNSKPRRNGLMEAPKGKPSHESPVTSKIPPYFNPFAGIDLSLEASILVTAVARARRSLVHPRPWIGISREGTKIEISTTG